MKEQKRSRSQCLEASYTQSKYATDKLCYEEIQRRQKLAILLLQEDNNDLNAQLALKEDHIDSLELLRDQHQDIIETGSIDMERLRNDVRLKSRDLETLKVSVEISISRSKLTF